ncbi:MAG: isochorismatase family protein [Bacillota bacterium]|nr:isochorismatase family protein [Bacillota bacterium]
MQDYLEQVKKLYQSKGIGKKIGFGEKPSILVVDYQQGFTHKICPLGSDYDKEIENTRLLLDAARYNNIPRFFTVNGFNDIKDAGIWGEKIESNKYLIFESLWTSLDDRLGRLENEPVIKKNFPSSFFGTSLITRLISAGSDTLIIVGCTTSGCVRATVVDAVSHGFRVIIPEECVGDRHEIPHRVSLFDIESKYGDVVTTDETIEYLYSLSI